MSICDSLSLSTLAGPAACTTVLRTPRKAATVSTSPSRGSSSWRLTSQPLYVSRISQRSAASATSAMVSSFRDGGR
eukprot:5336561-Pyramimonas_sp.AAC.1